MKPSSAELSILGLALLLKSADAPLTGDRFLNARWGKVWDCMRKMHESGSEFAMLSIEHDCNLSVEEMAEIVSAMSTPNERNMGLDDLRYMAELISESRIEHDLKRGIDDLSQRFFGSELVREVASLANRIESARVSDVISVEVVATEVFNEFAAVRDGATTTRTSGIPTGITALDEQLTFGGLPRGNTTVLAGATSSGKSALANTCILSAARNKHGVLCVALEDSPSAVVTRMVSKRSGLNNKQLQRRIASPGEWSKLASAVSEICTYQIDFIDSALNITDLCSKIRCHVSKHNTGLVVIDYLQLLRSGIHSRSRQEDVDHVFGEIVRTSRRINAATLVVSQLKRTNNNMPTKEDLYHSGALEQWAHSICLLWRPELKERFPLCTLLIAKQKNGPTGQITIGWNGETCSYSNPKDPSEVERYKKSVEQLRNTRERQWQS